ncbi:hypothetical protein LTR10_013075 [Elasticomyces elasticus]|uniref:Uncharacterized protein n=1 Tax=Exophiala sideris TaxID=1016849 RepID=A0ABR0JCQ2_9EURO|nr:hypothetical protein LTR10_013075 [Elasticomyces elasticus]KAK5030450.1 hypothetical protein LTS07_005234 [Exophiala sideris]KAK5038503.1 hypothetical protein LTR13_004250 [Exophiala sideris]KAK5060386.1 hypothetical protein LTR69_005703 [Exophiala sideris]KAK5183296.1 hypothetical protein LTR44_004297 [Eurotiomycetes sp. CCFEE 6388]
MTTRYAQQPMWDERGKVDRITQTHLQLVKWFDRLPKSLRISESSLQPSPPAGEYDPSGGDVHSRSCQTSAAKISTILRIYRDNFTHPCIPISAVHPAFTAAIIHLLDLKTADPIGRRRAMRRFEICLRALYEMNTNWDWANRCIRAIQSLATQWQVDIWSSSGLIYDIPPENRRQFRMYEDSCLQANATGGDGGVVDPFDEFFNAWTYDQAFMDGAFDFFDGS